LAELERAWHKGKPYDIVFLDQMMPGLSGESFAARMRAIPAFAETKLVLISSSGSHDIKKSALRLVDAILEKPTRQVDLLNCLAKLYDFRLEERDSLRVQGHRGDSNSARLADSAAGEHAREGLDLLLAEDNKINQRFALALLNKAGHNVEIVDNGLKAVDAVSHKQYDAVLMDIQMPELGGVEATAQIRALPPPACDTYIIAMTADAMSGAREEYLAAGINDYISKPVDANLLLSTLARLPKRTRPVGAAQISTQTADKSSEVIVLESAKPPSLLLDYEKLVLLQSLLPFSSIEGLITLFRSEIDGHLTRIHSSWSDRDLNALAREAHSMVSTAGNVGAMTLSELARAVERACKENRTASVGPLIAQLAETSATVNIALKEWLTAQRSTRQEQRAAHA
jgi:CheY-like chemotaxis protein/HPt (histidine-containing phosphotransfer) domain-containing protein